MSLQIKNLLEKFGLDADDYEKLMSNERKAEDVWPKARDYQKQLLINDQEWKNSLHHQFRNEENARIRRLLKKEFGLTNEEVENKFPDEIIPMARERLTSMLENTYKNATDSQLMVELQNTQKLLRQKEQELERIKNTEIPALEARFKKETEDTKKQIELERFIERFNLQNPIELVYPAIRDALIREGLELRLDGRKLVLQRPDGTTPMNEDGSQFITLENFVQKKLRDFNVIKVSNPVETTTIQQNVQHTQNGPLTLNGILTPTPQVNPTKKLLGLEKALERVIENEIKPSGINY